MAKVRVGFYKSVQGSFTEERIAAIKHRLVSEHDIELVEVDFRQGVLIHGKVYVGDICLNDLDVYFWHDTVWPSQTGADSYYIHLLRAIGKDVAVINGADETETTNDKLRAHARLIEHGLPVSRYALIRSDDRQGIQQAFEQLQGDVLVKPRFGGWGSGIVRCQSIEDLYSTIELSVAVAGKHTQFLLEQFYENDPNGWVSISMIGQTPLIAYKKPLSLSSSTWKVYDPEKRDGRGEQSVTVEPSDGLVDLAKKAQAAIGKDIIGFDFILTPQGYVIVDENGRPGLYEHCLQEKGIDLVDVIARLIADKAAIYF